ncbi:MAG: SemiSWEET family transporter [Acidobacteriota bacterium]|nr:SemiSWEET family transporter [Acidobacteriota bacterium]
MQEAIGWASSVILVLTIGKQIYKQWKEGSSESVSKWLFVGQLAASLGFVVYSWLVRNWVFVVTNSLMIVNAVLGLLIVLYHRKREKSEIGGQQLEASQS